MTGDTPTARAVRDHKALAALDQYCKNEKGGAFASPSETDKDAIIDALESRTAKLDSVDGQAFFEVFLENVR
jgi:gluconate 2-dehydrogenase gamma chain